MALASEGVFCCRLVHLTDYGPLTFFLLWSSFVRNDLNIFLLLSFFFITKGLLLFLIYFSRRFFTRKWNKHPIDNKWNNPHRSNLQNCNLLIRRWHIAPTLKPLGFYFSFLFFLLPFFDGSTFPFLFAQSNQRGLFAFWLKYRWTCQIQFSFTPHQFICQTKDCVFFF